jgi:hypothetical protein
MDTLETYQLVASSAPLRSWLQIAAHASATAAIVVVSSSRPIAIIITVLMPVACCYHVQGVCIIVAVPTTFLSGAIVKLIFCIDVMLR